MLLTAYKKKINYFSPESTKSIMKLKLQECGV